jgi:hypothetical protein
MGGTRMKRVKLSEYAEAVSKYLTEFGLMLGRVINTISDKRDKKWLKDIVLSIIKVQTLLDIAIVVDKLKKKGKK